MVRYQRPETAFLLQQTLPPTPYLWQTVSGIPLPLTTLRRLAVGLNGTGVVSRGLAISSAPPWERHEKREHHADQGLPRTPPPPWQAAMGGISFQHLIKEFIHRQCMYTSAKCGVFSNFVLVKQHFSSPICLLSSGLNPPVGGSSLLEFHEPSTNPWQA